MDKATDVVMAGFGRDEELEADRKGIVIANTVGLRSRPASSAFLTTLTERNKASTEKQGLFASHPEMKERLEKLDEDVKDGKLDGDGHRRRRATRSTSPTSRWPSPRLRPSRRARRDLPAAAPPRPTTRRRPAKKDERRPRSRRRRRGFGLGKLIAPSSGGEKQASETTGSSAARGVDTERNAKGGGNPKLVPVTVTAADLTAFKKDGKLN